MTTANTEQPSDPTEGMTEEEKRIYKLRQRLKARAKGQKPPAGSPTQVPGPTRVDGPTEVK